MLALKCFVIAVPGSGASEVDHAATMPSEAMAGDQSTAPAEQPQPEQTPPQTGQLVWN